MKPVLNNFSMNNKVLPQPLTTNRLNTNYANNISGYNVNVQNPMISTMNNVGNINSITSVNNIGIMNNMNEINNINNMNNLNNVNNINSFPLNIQQNQELIMGYNTNNINTSTKNSSYLFNSDTHSPTNNATNILRGNTVTPSNSTIATTSPVETPISDMNDMFFGGISTNHSNSNSLSNEYVDNYHRRITMEERRMCQSSEENRKNNKNGNNNSNINERQLNQNASAKRHVIPRGNELILSRVISGLDDRTTFMIRNIPNKYTQQMLIDTINDTHFGQFDFLYLRMDFKNRCNVGYAFINFVDIKAVISFAEKVVGKKWTRFNSDKICTLSYANIQGRDSLIEKFKNSSVMLEDPSYRPKIFYTSGELRGQEEPFPPPTIPLQFKPYSSVLLNSNLQKSSIYNNK
eukprot:jgi/Orpsp1_1/1176347/evm.model.c7180000057262.1